MDVLTIQKALAAAGCEPGPLDGVAGPATDRAIRAFQRKRGLDADGIVGPLTSEALGVSPPLSAAVAFAGIDTFTYPGDAAVAYLRGRTNIRWFGMYLGPATSHPDRGWMGRREMLVGMGFGLAPIYVGSQVTGPGSRVVTAGQGLLEGRASAGLMRQERFPAGSCVYLDLENGPPFRAAQRDHLQAWAAAVRQGGYRPGVYCSYLFAAQAKAAVPDARMWPFHVRIATAHLRPGTEFPTISPALSGYPGATNWQLENEARISVPGYPGGLLAVDLNSSLMADPSAPDAAA